jgi:undecaprenyl-diphosphatase
VAIWFLIQMRRNPERRERVRAWLAEREDQRGWRWIVRASGPVWRWLGRPAAAGADEVAMFSLRRLQPGALGLELTTLLALLAVGGFVFYLIGDAIRPGGMSADPIRADATAARIARDLADPTLIDVAKVLTALGSLPVVAAAVLVTSIGVAVRRRWLDAGVLVAGLGLSYAAVHIAKAAYDRPRPAGSLVETAGSAYPSAHAVYSVALIACATVLVRAGTGWAVRAGAETVAIGLVVVVGVTRVYLRAHELSDVIGGIALGVAVWAFVGSVALIAAYVRHNGHRSP